MNYSVSDFFLEFIHPFAIAHGTRLGTDLVFLTLEENGFSGTGEASLPPYLTENPGSVKQFISEFFAAHQGKQLSLGEWLTELHGTTQGNFAARACIDIALHNLYSQSTGKSVAELLQVPIGPVPNCTFTIGMDDPDTVCRKVEQAEGFEILKIKLGGANDRALIEAICKCTTKTLCVDVNQGWHDRYFALEMIKFLASSNVILVEQPLPVAAVDDQRWLYERSPLPLFADESAQTTGDIPGLQEMFHGVNVKLMKCGGVSRAKIMIDAARKQGLKVLLGSMSESGIGIAAAASLAPLADLVDLDGPLLTKNNPYATVEYVEGKVEVNKIKN